MDKRLVYVVSKKLLATPEHLTVASTGRGMLLDQDNYGISLHPLAQYQFEPQINLSPEQLELAKMLHIGFVWQKFQQTASSENNAQTFKRLLFIDYETEKQCEDYPEFADQGFYYELGEVIPYICVDPQTNAAVLYSDQDYQSHSIEEVLLSVRDPKYQTDEYLRLFASQTKPYAQWFNEEEKKYHFSSIHQSYEHNLFMSFDEWKEKIALFGQKLKDKAEAVKTQQEYELLLKQQANRINHEITRALSANPKDLRTISGFEEQLKQLHQRVRILFHQSAAAIPYIPAAIDDVITDINPNDGEENAMALQDLLSFILNSQKDNTEAQSAELFLDKIIIREMTVLQAYKIFNICICYFKWSLYYTKTPMPNAKALDSYDRNLIAFAARMLIICLAFIINATQLNS